ncbi:AAA family ATPase [Streptomyces tsukubensis]|uniref:ATP-dependent Clp protease ATP-binding subunit n=2 Tax=Streptomyces TaxID=1883 RepID=A0A7G3UNQ5_STRT9|nr:AAA family ATPase [Streptomyces tsukubensis]AZK98227.1 AAA family ATPase [Streptomyces tsukubensis]QKM72017.1 ATP-dependent Clp protease ATP-binding subunit [Streptomyces tsukubensis NRRL18488]TAI41005.1 ATP-dependent Clp protease ATP-binding subunit [Streptomyces tsukubensis]
MSTPGFAKDGPGEGSGRYAGEGGPPGGSRGGSPDGSPDGDGTGPVTADGMMPLWAVSLGWELRRGRQVILDGQIRDRWWFDDRPASFRQLVAGVLEARGADVVGWWDPVAGLTFPLPGHAERFAALEANRPRTTTGTADGDRREPRPWADRAGRGARQDRESHESGGPPPHAANAAHSANTRSSADPVRREGGESREDRDRPRPRSGTGRDRERAGLLSPRPAGPPRAFDDVVATVHRLAASPEAATAFVFQDVDHQLPPGRPESNAGYLRLREAMTDAVTPHSARSGRPPHARNAVLCAVGDVGRLPGWFPLEDPRIATLHIGPPDPGERRLWLTWLLGEFNGSQEAGRHEVEALVGATDGMSGWDIEALARTSWLRDAPLRKPDKLLELHRLNVSVDPWTQLDRETVARAAGVLGTRVVGQSRAVDAVAAALQAAYVGVDFGGSGNARPRGAFFFVGPTGVGKTELAKAVAELMFGDQSAYARFDMSEYQQEHAAERLAGAPPGFIGHEQGGELTRRVQERPFSVLLFDEIEKAHPRVLDKFLQILEDGRLTDGRGQTAYFSQCLIIFTSNTGAEAVQDLLAEDGDEVPYSALEAHFTRAVEEKFRTIGRPEIYGRLKPGVVVFDMLRREHIVRIADRLLGQLTESVRERHQVELVPDADTLHPWITGRMDDPERRAYGGRQIRNELERLRAAVVAHFLAHRPPPGSRVRLGTGTDGRPWVRADEGNG